MKHLFTITSNRTTMKYAQFYKFIRSIFLGLSLCLLSVQATASEQRLPKKRIQLALILDTSGSMGNLIDQTRAEFWYIIDGILYEYEQDYVPEIEVALLEYGNRRLGRENRYMRIAVPMTYDVDWVADALYQLRARGSKEYAGEVLDLALNGLDWDDDPRVVKEIYIAGNESFYQGRVYYRDVIKAASYRSITVNTIFCGDYWKGVRLGWQNGARAGLGAYAALDLYDDYVPDVGYIDNSICELNVIYNDTYIPYGPQGNVYYQRFINQDRYAYRRGAQYQATRTLVKCRPFYRNAGWDLVDAYYSGNVNLGEIDPKELPPEMRQLTPRQRITYVEKKKAERDRLRKRIANLSQQRRNNRTSTPNDETRVSARQKKSLTEIMVPHSRNNKQISRNPADRPIDIRPKETRGTAKPGRTIVQEKPVRVVTNEQSRQVITKDNRNLNREELRSAEQERMRRQQETKREVEQARIRQQREEQRRVEQERIRRQQEERREAEQERILQQREEQRRVEQERVRRQQEERLEAEQERIRQQREEQRKAEQERVRRQQEERREAEQERIRQQREEQRRVEQERIRRQQEERREAEQERIRQQREEQRRAEQERVRRQQEERREAEQERIRQQREEQRRAEQERVRRQQEERHKAEQERIRQQREEQRRAEQERVRRQQEEKRKAEQERIRKQQEERKRNERSITLDRKTIKRN